MPIISQIETLCLGLGLLILGLVIIESLLVLLDWLFFRRVGDLINSMCSVESMIFEDDDMSTHYKEEAAMAFRGRRWSSLVYWKLAPSCFLF